MRLLHGRPLAERVNARTMERVAALARRGVVPSLDVVRSGADPAAGTYLARITKLAAQLGVAVRDSALPSSEADVVTYLRQETPPAHGVLLLTPAFALFNGTNLLLYPEGRPAAFPSTVIVHTEPDWKIATGMTPAGGTSFTATNYHDLVDMPFYVGRFAIGRWHLPPFTDAEFLR